MNKGIIIVLMLGIVSLFTAAPASAFTLAGNYRGPVEIKFTGFTKSLDNDPDSSFSDETWGVFQITSITTLTGSNLWTPGQDNEYLYGMLYGLTDIGFPTMVGSGFEIKQKGGLFDIYISSTKPSDLGGSAFKLDGPNTRRTATDEYDTVTNLPGSTWLSGEFAPGVISGDGTTTVFQEVELATSPTSGQGSGYADVTGGDFASMFNSDGFNPDGTPRDLFFNFFVSPSAPTGWDQRITDPIQANAVPEPASMLLFGTGLAGAALRRKFSA